MKGTTIKYEPKKGKPTFWYTFFAGRDENGKRIQKVKRGFRTERECGDLWVAKSHRPAFSTSSVGPSQG
jgi:hypothetical protein